MNTVDTHRVDRMTGALAAIDELVAARLPRLSSPGVVVGLTDREHALGFVCQGVASLASGAPVEPDTRFQIGSISKSFTAAALLQEREAGRIDLDAPVTDYVPWFSVGSRLTPITLHHLLAHTSGLPMGTESTAEARHALWSLRDTELACAPGEHFLYSNDGYKLAGLAIEAVTGRPAHRVIAERIVAPLGMPATETTIRRDSPLPVATGYQPRPDDRPVHAGMPLIEAPLIESCTSDGSIVSSAVDMLAYARVILNRGDAPGGRLLSEESFALWASRVVEDPDEPGAFYGYGLVTRELDGFECVGHSGGMVGFNSLLVTEAQTGIGVIVLLNGLDDRMEMARFALRAVRAALAGALVPRPAPPADPTFVGEAAPEYAGAYVGAEPAPAETGAMPSRLVLVARDGRLFVRAPAPALGGTDGTGRAAADDPQTALGTGPAGVVDDNPALETGRTGVDDVYDPGAEVALERRGDDLFVVPHAGWDLFHLRFERDDGAAVVALSFGPLWFAYEGRAPRAAPAPDPAWGQLVGTYRSYDPWNPVFRVISRRGRLLLVAPWLEPTDELDLVPLPGGGFRVGAPAWRPDRLTFDTVIDGHATRAVYDGAPFYRTFT